jgi:hypothetical protein
MPEGNSIKINYLIAASSHRASRYEGNYKGEYALRWHFRELVKTNTNTLSQVTLIRTLPLVRQFPGAAKRYWDAGPWDRLLECPLVKIDIPDVWFSYSSWMQVVAEYGLSFDYYILIEDDYYPVLPNFAEVLVELHKKKLPNGGYLNAYTALKHAANSNGIIDSKTFVSTLQRYKNPIKAIEGAAQVKFSQLFDNICDWTDEYRTLMYIGNNIRELSHNKDLSNKIDIFCPIQYLGTKEKDFEKSISD